MRLLGTYLWKEWRDHRAVLVGMVLAVPLLLVVMGLSLPQKAFESMGDRASQGYVGFAGFAALACLALFVVSLATDLVPGEARRGHRWFLERLPGGLGAAFRGKFLIFAVGAALFAAYGYLAGAVTCRLVAGEWPSLPSLGTTTWMIAIAVLWTFAVSCALPRGALSLPAVAALALLLALPAVLLWKLYPSPGPLAWWRWESGALWTVGAIVAAWVAFRQAGGGFLRASRACLLVGGVCAMPYWADAAHDAYAMRRESVPVLWGGFLGEGGRYAFLNRHLSGPRNSWGSPLAPVILDLETGVARDFGSPVARFRPATQRGGWYEVGTPQRYVGLDSGPILDARTCEVAHPGEEDLRAAAREATPWRLNGGRRAWFLGGILETDAEGGGVEILAKSWVSVSGLGFQLPDRQDYYDFTRQRSYKRRDLALRGAGVWIRPGSWLTYRKGSWHLFDPDSNAFTDARGLGPKDKPRAVADDGRVFLLRGGRPVLVDPETGAVRELRTPELPEADSIGEATSAFGWPTRVPDGRRVFLLSGGAGDSRWCALARFDGTDTLSTTAVLRREFVALLGCLGNDEAIVVVNETTVLRLRFGSDEREEIWRVR